ncbi:DUF7594 domain-containing protein [Pseudactinotalea terrae]|uniref:CBM96 family carbohydrate-binding protein n=1 Tax=Pseudactinotalea terrae TaxID=1743262 RepID=UPI0012E31C6E|nr:DNRLRE domain-containing protein [Pseudactinotalea terrae]
MRRRTFLAGSGAAALMAAYAHFTLSATNAAAQPALAPHPRLLLHSFDPVKELVSRDETAARWYADIKTGADRIMREPVGTYEIPDGLRLLSTSRQTLRRVYSLGFAHGVEGGGDYAQRMWEELEAVCAFPNWNHARHFLDTAEMLHAVAVGYDWLYEVWSPSQRTIMEEAIVRHGLLPGIAAHEGNGTGAGLGWPENTNNWNIVCNGGLIVGALAVADAQPDHAHTVLDLALRSLPRAVEEYGPDGGYPEGVGSYWEYATMYLVLLIEALTTATEDDRGLVQSPGLDSTGLFPIHLTGPTGNSFNYYDGGTAAPRPPEMFWLARTYDNPVFGWWGAQSTDLMNQADNAPAALLWYQPELSRSPVEASLPLEGYFRHSEVVSMRSAWESSGAVFVAGKGGDNATKHGDLDLGSFVLDALAQRWAVELGADDYGLPGYFDYAGPRWTYYRKRAEGQNTLVFNPGGPHDQSLDAVGTVIARESGPTAAYAIADLTAASADVDSWRRGWRLYDDRRQMVVQDEFVTTEPSEVWWFMHTTAEVTIAEDGRSATLVRPGASLVARIVEPRPAVFYLAEARPLWFSPDPTEQAPVQGIRKLAIRLQDVTDVRLAVQFTPLHAGERVPPVAAPMPLDRWDTGPERVAQVSAITLDGEVLPGFDRRSYSYDLELPTDVVVEAAPADPAGKVVVHRPGSDGSIRVDAFAPGARPGSYQIWPVRAVGPGTFPTTVIASTHDGNPPANTVDGDLTTRWSAQGDGEWVGYDLGTDGPVHQVDIAWYSGDKRRAFFDIEVASEGETSWRRVFSGASSGTTAELEPVTFEASTARFLRIVGHGNEASDWNSIIEVVIDGRDVPMPEVEPYLAALALSSSPVLIGETNQAVLTAISSDGGTASVENLQVGFVAREPDIVTVGEDGLITGRGEGTADVAAFVVTDDWRLLHARTTVVVSDPRRPRIEVAADTYVNDGGKSDTNYGSLSELLVKASASTGFSRLAFLRFHPVVVPDTIESVVLNIYCRVRDSAGTRENLHVASVEGSFDEETTTWDTRPPLGSMFASVSVDDDWAWREVDITATVADQVVDGQEVTLALTQDVPAGRSGLATVIGSRESEHPPYLRVQLT